MRLACVALLIATTSLLAGQDKPATDASKPPDSAQPVKRDYRFEVASIRPAKHPEPQHYGPGQEPPHAYTPGRYRDTQSLTMLALKAFGLTGGTLVRPSWMDSAWFTVNATVPEGAARADLPIMIQHLLEDRFGLVFHRETRHMAGYELVVAKSGPKLTKSVAPTPDASTVHSPMDGIEFGKNGIPQFGKDVPSRQIYSYSPPTAWWHGRNESMRKLASAISNRLREPVTDATGLEGGYDFTLTFNFSEESSGPEADDGGASTPTEYPPLRDALRQELGLELRAGKKVPVDVLVVDSVNKVPTEN